MFEILEMKRLGNLALARRQRGIVLLGLALIGCVALLLGCARDETPTPLPSPLAVATVPLPSPPARPAASLVPTFTPVPTQTPLPTATAVTPSVGSEEPSPTPVSFEEIIVNLRYRIPALGLDRRLLGDMANRITVLDAATGQQTEYTNQGGVILEMRQALGQADLVELPDGCDRCVSLTYELSIEEQENSGWIQDAVLLASVENYMAVALGPHFPSGTIAGLRRSASPYAPAHTVALTDGGELWAWSATEMQIGEPAATFTDTMSLRAAVEGLPIAELGDSYVVDCEGSPVETLFFDIDGETSTSVILCPEFSLPSTLLPVYLELDALVEPVVADQRLARPPAAFPLTALLDYRRADGSRLMLFHDGSVVALDVDAVSYTSVLTSAQVISLTTSLSQSGVISPGLSTFELKPTVTVTPGATVEAPVMTSILVLRGPGGILEGEWEDTSTVEALAELNDLLDRLIGLPEPTPEGTAAPESTLTPEDVDITTTPTAAPTP